MPKPKPPIKPGKLNKKIGPLPAKYWIGIGAALILLLILYFRAKSSGGTTVEGESIPYSPLQVSPQQAASAGTPSANTPVTQMLDAETLAALGIGMPTNYVTGTDLASQLDSVSSNLAAQIAAATLSAPVTTTPTAAPAKTPPAVKTATAAPVKKTAKPAPAKKVQYFTYAPGKAPKGKKAQEIKPVKGKKIQFKKDKGYYYA